MTNAAGHFAGLPVFYDGQPAYSAAGRASWAEYTSHAFAKRSPRVGCLPDASHAVFWARLRAS